jgi:hypothetical protein
MLGFGRSRCGDVGRGREHVVCKRTQLTPTMLGNLCDKLTSSEGSIVRSTTADVTRRTTGRERGRISISDGSSSPSSANASSLSRL